METSGVTSLNLADATAEQLCAYYRLTDEDAARIAESGKAIVPRLEALVEDFYAWMDSIDHLEEYFPDLQMREQVAGQQHKYWVEFFSHPIDEEYLAKRRAVGETHARIGLPLSTYLAGSSVFEGSYGKLVDGLGLSEEERIALRGAISRRMHLDMGVVIEAYASLSNQTLSSQTRSLMEMSTPVTQIWSGMLLLPVVGIIDSQRAQDIMTATLEKISVTQSKIFILDISGVGVVDTAVANHLIKVTKATKLMGCESIISGVSPAIAETMVELGIEVGHVRTTAKLMDALETAFRLLGLSIAGHAPGD